LFSVTPLMPAPAGRLRNMQYWPDGLLDPATIPP
jgi:hypothetical protein